MNRAIKIQSILIQVDFWTSLLKGMVLKKLESTQAGYLGAAPCPLKPILHWLLSCRTTYAESSQYPKMTGPGKGTLKGMHVKQTPKSRFKKRKGFDCNFILKNKIL